MVLDKTSLVNRIRDFIGDRDDDEAISFLEDVNDSVNDFTKDNADDWKKKYEDNDASWRKRYRDRFFNNDNEDDDIDKDIEDNKPLTFDSLFKKE